MVTQKLISRISVSLALGALMTAAGAARAKPSVIAGRAVGHVFLGMDRADVWKVLNKPTKTYTVPHGMELYGEDEWTENGYTLTVVSEHDKVIQAEFNSPRMTTTDGLTADSTLAQVRRRHPAMTVRLYNLVYRVEPGVVGYQNDADGYYLDDVRRGIAFRIATQEAIDRWYLNSPPGTIIIHRPGRRAVPICEGHWSAPAPPDENRKDLRLLRSWFTPGGAGRAR